MDVNKIISYLILSYLIYEIIQDHSLFQVTTKYNLYDSIVIFEERFNNNSIS